MYKLVRPLLFLFDAESIHHLVMNLASLFLGFRLIRNITRALYNVQAPELTQTLWGLTFENPVGLAAGFDKNASHFNTLHALGFGFIEIGTVTGQRQTGNERPRIFRLPADRALLNRMGFNNDGSALVAQRLENAKHIEPLLGVNIGKTKVVALEDAPEDYELSFERLYPYARYFTVNVSSPNTPNLRQLQEREPLLALMQGLHARNQALAAERNETPRPILLKIAPDISEALLEDILSVIEEAKVDGIIATNTTISRESLKTPGQESLGNGGISGAPVQERALEVISLIYQKTQGNLPIIGVGGIFTPEDALRTIEAGASLVQVWTGFVYEGPAMVKRINKHLIQVCTQRGLSSISELRGSGIRSNPS